MLERGIPQAAILALTFTNKAAREMESRVKNLTGKKLQNLTVSTFHAFGLKILREEAELLGLRKNFSVYDEVDRQSLIKESLHECHRASLKADLYALGQVFSGIKTGLLGWTRNASEIAGLSGRNDWEPVYEAYQQGLRVYNSVDFDDLLVLPLELFEKHPEVLERFRKRFRYIMVDEFQDTSLVQYRLMKMLARGGEPSSGQNAGKNAEDPSPGGADSAGVRNICVVGDDDQSIYSWRGANYENILLFEKDFPGVTEIKLEQNYRSTTTILEAANGVISHNTHRKEKALWSGRDGGKPIELFYPENESAEADFIASRIRHLSIMESRKYQDFGVLTRTNSLARNIEEAFLAADIPYRVSGGTSFFQRREIKDILSYLRVIANPDDDVNLLRIINTPRRGIGRTTVASLGDFAKRNHTSLWNALERLRYAQSGGQQGLFQDKHIHGELEDFMNQIEFFRQEILERKSAPGTRWALSQKVRSLTDSIDYWGYLVAEHSRDEKKARWKFGNIEYFIRMIENWEKDPDNPDAGLYPWLNRISLITRDDGEDDNEGRANIMTIHAAKGLEFPVVFIAGAEKGLIPHEKSLSEGGDEAGSVEEERRLFYVAITRAREKLYITSCQKRRKLRDTVDCVPSPFLEEIPQHLVEYHKSETAEEDPAEADEIFARIMEQLK
jgi:DNA helicase-2/ATP-dependent DNA helicase PcrA